ncbi:MAG: helix-turn-helix domain-containing protein [Bacteroidales bacterium]|nr:helix-turn-helix domain-containing protein [Bacteroidales bacterium]
MRLWKAIVISLLVAACSSEKGSGPATVEVDGVVFHRMSVERLPDLNHKRGAHFMVCLNGEPTVFGGHTDGFVMEQTAEYYKDGRWVEIPMLYPHDFGFAVKLPDGKVMLGGGAAENFGIGQSWGVEIYDQETHSFNPAGILDRKRTNATAMAFGDGRVVVSGNWHADDNIEDYLPGRIFSPVKPVTVQRNLPYIFQSDSSQAIIFSSMGVLGDTLGGTVDRLTGEPFEVPLMEEWTLNCCTGITSFNNFSIGDYTYLIHGKRKADGQDAIIKVAGEHFSPLDMEQELPVLGIDGESISWGHKIRVNRKGRTALLMGFGNKNHYYFAQINYDATLDGGKASLELFYAEDQAEPFMGDESWDIMPDGRIILAGGISFEENTVLISNNFKTNSIVYVFNTQPVESGSSPLWWFISGFIVVVGGIVLAYRLLVRKPEEDEASDVSESAKKTRLELQEEISRLIEEKELFRKKDIRISDIASELATNRTYISLIVNSSLGTSFSDLINSYRIEYAKKLMTEHPEMSHTEVAEESGFSSRTSFLRTFKAKTGQSPTEWKQSLRQDSQS